MTDVIVNAFLKEIKRGTDFILFSEINDPQNKDKLLLGAYSHSTLKNQSYHYAAGASEEIPHLSGFLQKLIINTTD